MKHLLKGIVITALVLYPFLVGYALSQGHLVWISVLLIVLGMLRLFSKGNTLLWPLTGFAILCGGFSLILQDQQWLKLYPVLMSVGSCVIFATTLLRPPSMIERFARLAEPDLPPEGVAWTRQVTKVWCGFFIINALIALYTVYAASMQIWVLYNGFISYMLMGILLLGEYLLRKRQQALHQ
ncbi:septation protein IspZ [Acinetobacter sp. ASP199]|uniref:septation protein IspZ n=1 Tax=unclassified Acinetobacter TaxID=196816 RepID=UPI001F6227CA|nr:septation protein IspZ [Acinetobacter sp. ASP199]UNT58799.1 septation protein IspZ [Acinetobacter sp. ASP199]